MNEDDYTKFSMTAKSFLPNGKYIDFEGKTRELGERPLRFSLNDISSDLIAAVPAEGIIDCCPLCDSKIQKGSIVIITNTHNIFPCWVCNKLVQQPIINNLEGLQ